MSVNHASNTTNSSVVIALLPVMAAVLVGFINIGVVLPVLPLHVKNDLGFGTFVVGLVAGAQFAASLISRIWSGSYSDKRGAKNAVVVGLIAAAVAGALYLVSLWLISIPELSVSILLVGRAVLGGAESFIITGGIAWGLAKVDKEHAGKVIAWIGTAMFAAMALGGPVGALLFDVFGFQAIALLNLLLPLLVLTYLARIPAFVPHPHTAHTSLGSVMKAVWLPGLGAALASTGYCTILAFSSLYYSTMHWQPVWMAFTTFGIALILARVVAGHLPDKLGGAKVALIFVLLQSAGLLLIWHASQSWVASVGALLAGFGYSLVYPGFGVVAVSRIEPHQRGLAMGIFTAFLDVAMAIGSPALGWVGGHAGLETVFLIGALVVLCASCVALVLLTQTKRIAVIPPEKLRSSRMRGEV